MNEMHLPPERELPEPDRMLAAILDSRPARRTRLLAAIAVAACFAVLAGLGIWATTGGTGNDVADPPANRSPMVTQSSTATPTPTPSQATAPTPTHRAEPARTAGASTARAATRPPAPSEATPRARAHSTRTPRADDAPRSSRNPGTSTKSAPRARPPGKVSPRPTASGPRGEFPPTLPIQSTSRKPYVPSSVQGTVIGRKVKPREADGRAYLYVQLKLCGSGPHPWASSVSLDRTGPATPDSESSGDLSSMPPLWSGSRLQLTDDQCVNRTTLWLRPSVSEANSTHLLTVETSSGVVHLPV